MLVSRFIRFVEIAGNERESNGQLVVKEAWCLLLLYKKTKLAEQQQLKRKITSSARFSPVVLIFIFRFFLIEILVQSTTFPVLLYSQRMGKLSDKGLPYARCVHSTPSKLSAMYRILIAVLFSISLPFFFLSYYKRTQLVGRYRWMIRILISCSAVERDIINTS